MEVFFPGSSTATRRFETKVIEMPAESTTEVGPVEVIPFEVVHACGAPAYALRVRVAGRTVTYSGDTEWTEALVRASAGADLLVAEAYFYEKRVPFHLDFRTLMAHRNEISAKRLIVTHMSLDMLERVAELDVEAAADDLTVEI
jgi:ribonuclease BN (tRNA processing enzyme)